MSVLVWPLLPALLGCAADPKDTATPTGETGETGDTVALDTEPFGFDTVDTGGPGLPPEHLLTLTQSGSWDLSPTGGPWSALTGELHVAEVLDDDQENPTCQASFSLSGTATTAHACGVCEVVFEIDLSLIEGDPAPCQEPDLPADGDRVSQGWSSSQGAIYLDYQGSGVWLRWYDATELEDRIEFEWTATLGVAVEQEGA